MSTPLSYRHLSWLRQVCRATFSSVRHYTAKPLKPKKIKSDRNEATKFVDFKQLSVIGGSGGDGCLSFLSMFKKEFAGPDGGDGGNGGHVIFKATQRVKSLNHLKSTIAGNPGAKGRNKDCHGKNADHLYIEVPLGTIVKDFDGNVQSNLEDENDYYIAARGGAGGKGNVYFVSSINTAPMSVEEGGKGEDRTLFVELRLMAHFGLIGFPNAGKSSLLRAISRGRPKVAAYPFTTLHPHVGMMEYDDHEQVAVADLPGLIEGAHKNKGLGISFLRHTERCLCLLYVIDLSVPEPWTQLDKLKYELEQYSAGLSERPHVIIGNKMDLDIAQQHYQEMKSHTDLPVIPISALKRLNLTALMTHLRDMYDTYREW